MKDSHGRVIDYLRISLTDRCNFRCIYCMPEEGVQQLPHEEILRIEEIVQAVRVAAGMGIRSIRLTGGEPLVRLGVVDLVRDIANVPGIENISMTTNGVLLPRMADDLKAAGLSRVNISLDTLDPDQFRQITRRGELQQTLDGIDAEMCIRDRESNEAIVLAGKVLDYATRDMLQEILWQEDRHLDELEELQDQIEQMTLPTFL